MTSTPIVKILIAIAPIFAFLFYGVWYIDYSSPIVSALIGLVFLFFSATNGGARRWEDLSGFVISTICCVVMLTISSYEGPHIQAAIEIEADSLVDRMCDPNWPASDSWAQKQITEGRTTVKINYLKNGDLIEVRGSPSIFGGRVIKRVTCSSRKVGLTFEKVVKP